MKKTLLKNLHVINPCSDPAFIENAFVAISGETIESVDSSEPSGIFDEVFEPTGPKLMVCDESDTARVGRG